MFDFCEILAFKLVPVSVPGSTYVDHWIKIWESLKEIIKVVGGDPNESRVLCSGMLCGFHAPDVAEPMVANMEDPVGAIDQLEQDRSRGHATELSQQL